jgi:NADH:ubiquinone oxidoreductase subunit 3 (subunit A)
VYESFAAALVVLLASVTLVGLVRWGYAEHAASTWPQRTPFLGGGTPESHAWSRFHARWFPMALVFIAFEMEMMFMYPWAVVFASEGAKAMAEMGMFLGLLSVGLLYAWREGAFRWQ